MQLFRAGLSRLYVSTCDESNSIVKCFYLLQKQARRMVLCHCCNGVEGLLKMTIIAKYVVVLVVFMVLLKLSKWSKAHYWLVNLVYFAKNFATFAVGISNLAKFLQEKTWMLPHLFSFLNFMNLCESSL